MQIGIFARGPHPLLGDSVAYRLDHIWDGIRLNGGPRAKAGDLRTASAVIAQPWKVFEQADVYRVVGRPMAQYVSSKRCVPASPFGLFVVEVNKGMVLQDCWWVYPWILYRDLTQQEAEDRYLQSLGKEIVHAT